MTTMTMPRPRKDSGMEGMTAKWYAANTAEMMTEFIELAQRLASKLPQGSTVLEVAPGPGYLAIELAKLGSYEVTGLDLSRTFVRMAAKKAADAGVKVDFRQGSASSLPFESDSFDFLVCRAAFKNFANPVRCLQEMCRVLRPGAEGLIIDLRGDASSDVISGAVDSMGLSAINRILTKLAFKTMLIKRAYTQEQFEGMLAETKFRKTEILESGIGLEISMTK
ncbi:MAG: class I SAM-dependent methyltransferase [Terracidiphilus sp.]